LTTARWTARVVGALLLLLIAVFAIGEGVHPVRMFESLRVGLLTVTMLTMIVGQIAAWKWEGIGGLLILGSYVLFAVVNHSIPFNIVFGPWLLTGLLYLGCGWMKYRAVRPSSPS
jgi:hypothetical protein